MRLRAAPEGSARPRSPCGAWPSGSSPRLRSSRSVLIIDAGFAKIDGAGVSGRFFKGQAGTAEN
jgi:hypothetical protein